jgi:putative FmdB family regulatory protein
MPNYDYECESCGEIFEESTLIAQRKKPTEKPCPQENCEGKVKMAFAAPFVGERQTQSNKK